jgi:hypothetical protein
MRKALIPENRFGRYFFYAIGEIVLVVIGILIALQVNNWNQSRILKKQEKILLAEIHSEFNYNKTELESNLSRYLLVYNSLEKIIELFPIDIQSTNLDSLAFYMDKTFFVGNYDYSNTALQKIKMASSYDIISNKELRNLLLEWEVVLADYMEREESSIDYREQRYVPILNNYFSRPYKTGFKDPRAKLEFLETIEFENLIDSRRRSISDLFGAVQRSIFKHNINEVLDLIIELSGENLNENSRESTSDKN